MSDLHLSKGSTKPPLCEGKLRLYSMKFCPYAERARLILHAINVPHDIVNVNLKIKPDWIFEINPKGLVPVLDTGSKIITESLNICDFLNKEYFDNSLYPETEDKIKEDKEIINDFDKLITLYYASIREEGKNIKDCVNEMMPHLKKLETLLAQRGAFFGGEKPCMVDYMLWPWAERAGVMEKSFKEALPVDDSVLPHIFKWCKEMRSTDAVRKVIISTDRLYNASLFHKPGVAAEYDKI